MQFPELPDTRLAVSPKHQQPPAPPLRIAVIAACPFPAERGTPVRIRRLCEGLGARGHSVHVVTYHIGDKVDLPHVTVHRIAPVERYRKTAPGPTLTKLTVLDRRLVGKLADLLASERFDVIHGHHVEGLLVALAARGRRWIPVVFDSHTLLGEELPYYAPAPARGVVRWVGKLLDRFLPRLAEHTTTVTGEIRSRVVGHGRLDAGRVTVVDNGLELNLFETPAYRAPAPARGDRLIFAGNLAAYQGVDLMLKAFAHVRERHRDARLRIVSHDRFAPYEDLATELGVRSAVDVEQVSFDAVPDRLARADIGLNPRLDAPGLPQKTLNYLASGLPIVSFVGSGRHLTDGETALLVRDGDVAAFSDAICRLIEDPCLARRMSVNAKAFVREKASWEKSSAELEAVLYNVCHHPRKVRALGSTF